MLKKEYYYSVKNYDLGELLDFLEDCDRRYKDLDLRIFTTMTDLWIISNKDLYVPFENNPMKYKYRRLETKPTPERRWKGKWVDYKTKLATLREILHSEGGESMSKENEKKDDILEDVEEDLLLMTKEGEIKTGGIVVDEKKALTTPCHGYRMTLDGKTVELVWSPGVIGALSEAEKAKYCTMGTVWTSPPESLAKRWKILHEAGIKFPKK